MAIDVRIRSITALTSGGKTIGGVASNEKAMVVGDIDITTYTSGGELINAPDLGLTSIDGLHVSVVDVDGTVPSATQICGWGYDRALSLLLLVDGSGGVTDAGSNAQVRFVAFGDTASAPKLV
ncbi:hypothetical protein LCGC14_2352000 [marine sediment metagenome]|uniref:Uncharacterized protein n=1 Tax=marine sediment metagenome TaxID=412755 RepID=A0A0F9C8Y4_9ZZZZ